MSEQHAASGWLRAVPAITFVVGLLLGALVVGVGLDGDGTATDGDSTETPTSGADPTPTDDVQVVVPQECLQAAQTVTEATNLIRSGVEAIRDFRPDELADLLDRLEDLDAEAQDQAAQCSQVDVSQTP